MLLSGDLEKTSRQVFISQDIFRQYDAIGM